MDHSGMVAVRPRFRISRVAQTLAPLAAIFLLGACVNGDGGQPLEKLNRSYNRALERTADATTFPAGSEQEKAALDRLQAYFLDMNVDGVRTDTRNVYAENAYLNDNIVGITGVDEIEAYFVHATENSDEVSVRFLDVARGEKDYYVRWEMTIAASVLRGGSPVTTYGTSQFRFDRDGRVTLHRDFWDSASGIYEQLPVLGAILRYVHTRAASAAAR